MFALVHFSRVFPYIHPYLFPIEPAKATEPPPERAFPESIAVDPTRGEGVCVSYAGQNKRQKSLYRRQLRNQRNDTLTYCGSFRHAAG